MPSSSGESGVSDGPGVAGAAAESCAMIEMPGVGETQSLDDGTPDDDAAASTSPPKRCRSEQLTSWCCSVGGAAGGTGGGKLAPS